MWYALTPTATSVFQVAVTGQGQPAFMVLQNPSDAIAALSAVTASPCTTGYCQFVTLQAGTNYAIVVDFYYGEFWGGRAFLAARASGRGVVQGVTLLCAFRTIPSSLHLPCYDSHPVSSQRCSRSSAA